MRTIRRSIWCTLVLAVAALVFTAEADMQNDFWTEAAEGGLAEVALSNVALSRAQSPAVKQFAQQMVTDHTAKNQELATLAASKGVAIPTTLTAKQQKSLDKLSGRTGADFDVEYLKTMVKDHERMVRLFERESERGTDSDVKAFATSTLPTLRSHLSAAETLYNSTRTAARGDQGNSSNNNSSPNTNSSNVNRSTNRRMDTNRRPNVNTNGNTNSNGNTNTNSNSNSNASSNRGSNSRSSNGNVNNSNANLY